MFISTFLLSIVELDVEELDCRPSALAQLSARPAFVGIRNYFLPDLKIIRIWLRIQKYCENHYLSLYDLTLYNILTIHSVKLACKVEDNYFHTDFESSAKIWIQICIIFRTWPGSASANNFGFQRTKSGSGCELHQCGNPILKVRNCISAAVYSPHFHNQFICPHYCGSADKITYATFVYFLYYLSTCGIYFFRIGKLHKIRFRELKKHQ